jgi:hypothetical protein
MKMVVHTRGGAARPRFGRAPAAHRPALAEALEERLALATYTVTNTNDTGAGTLRQALLDANASIRLDDTIVFDAGFYAAPHVIDIIGALPQFSSGGGALTIVGPGSALLTVRKTDFGPAVYRRVFDSFSPVLNLSGMTLTGGNLNGAHGGGLSCTSASNVTLDDMVITGNVTTNDGGGIWLSNNATLTIRNSVITNNTARRGGGISYFDGGSLVMDHCTVSGNTSTGTSGRDVSGGGIYFFGPTVAAPPAGFLPSTLLIRNSTISNNHAAGGGGGFGGENLTGTLLIRNSTVSGNQAATSGGGILQNAASVTITVENSTITNNSAPGTTTGTNATGGGGICRVTSYAGTLNLTNSIVSGNSNPLTPDILTTNTTTNAQYSAIGSASGVTLSSASSHNVPFGTNLLLGPLANNGGRTLTHLPQAGSPLLNTGSNGLTPAELVYDQRGAGYPRVLGSSADIGAVESTAAAPPPKVAAVFVSGLSWATSFRNYLQTLRVGDAGAGYAVPAGAEQLRVLPWVGLTRISIRFSQDVTPHLADLVVTGVNTASYVVSDYGYDATTRTAAWYLAQALRNDRVTLTLDADPGGVSGASGRLDGEWADGSSAFPSGNGSQGGDFAFRLRALPGDADRNGTVLAIDASQVKQKFFSSTANAGTGAAAYSIFHDVNGSGSILADDFSAVKARFFTTAPAVMTLQAAATRLLRAPAVSP